MLINQQIFNKWGACVRCPSLRSANASAPINNVYFNLQFRSVKKATINQGKLFYSNQASDRSGLNLNITKITAKRDN